MTQTHFAAIRNNVVVGTRSSTSRSAEGTGKFGVYTHAVYVETRMVKVTMADGSEQVTYSTGVQTWHGSLKNAQSGLRQVIRMWTNDYNGVKSTVTATLVELVPVVVMAKRPKIGDAVPDSPK